MNEGNHFRLARFCHVREKIACSLALIISKIDFVLRRFPTSSDTYIAVYCSIGTLLDIEIGQKEVTQSKINTVTKDRGGKGGVRWGYGE